MGVSTYTIKIYLFSLLIVGTMLPTVVLTTLPFDTERPGLNFKS